MYTHIYMKENLQRFPEQCVEDVLKVNMNIKADFTNKLF